MGGECVRDGRRGQSQYLLTLSPNSVIIPEKLDSFINKFAEYTHEKWAFDKVGIGILPSPGTSTLANLLQDPSFPEPP